MKIVIRDDDLNHDFSIDHFKYYERIWENIPITFFCVPSIDFEWFKYLEVCEKIGPGCSSDFIVQKMNWYKISKKISNNSILLKYLKDKIGRGIISIGLHGSKHYQISKNKIIKNNFAFGAEYFFKKFSVSKILADKNYLEKFSDKVKWFAPPQNLISTENALNIFKAKMNLSTDLKILKDPRLFFKINLKDLFNILYWKFIKKIRFYYPFVINILGQKLVPVMRFNDQTDYNFLYNQILYLSKNGGECVVINTHLSAFELKSKNNKTVGNNFIALIELLRKHDQFKFIKINDL